MPLVRGTIVKATIAAEQWNNVSDPGSGLFFITMLELPPLKPDGHQRVALKSTHPAFAEIVQMTLSAQQRQATVELHYLESHHVRANSWDFGVLTVLS